MLLLKSIFVALGTMLATFAVLHLVISYFSYISANVTFGVAMQSVLNHPDFGGLAGLFAIAIGVIASYNYHESE